MRHRSVALLLACLVAAAPSFVAACEIACAAAEVVEKSAHDLDLHGPEGLFTLATLQFGYTRYFAARAGLAAGIGAAGSASVVPAALEPVYGARVNGGIGVFLTLRPAPHRM